MSTPDETPDSPTDDDAADDAIDQPNAGEGDENIPESARPGGDGLHDDGPSDTGLHDDGQDAEVYLDDEEMDDRDFEDREVEDEDLEEGDVEGDDVEDGDRSLAPVIPVDDRGEDDREEEAAEEKSRGRDVLIIGVVLVVLVGVLAAVLLLRGGNGPAYMAYGNEVSVEELKTKLDGLADQEVIDVVDNVDDASSEQRTQLAQVMSGVITEDVFQGAAEADGVQVTEEDIDAEIQQLVDTTFGGDQEQFDQAVAAQGLTEAAVRAQFRTILLAQALIGDDAPPADDAAVQEIYDAQFGEPILAHILTETEEEAQAALDRIEAGEEFGAVAAEVSIDGSSAQGGQLGPFQPGAFVPEFEEAAAALEPGDITGLVETEFGFHIITLQDPPPLEEVRPQIEQTLQQQDIEAQYDTLAVRLNEEAMVEVDPRFGTWNGLEGGLTPAGLSAETVPTEGAPAPAPSDGAVGADEGG